MGPPVRRRLGRGHRSKAIWAILGVLLLFWACNAAPDVGRQPSGQDTDGGDVVQLPDPVLSSQVSIEEALSSRRSVRDYGREPLSLARASQLAWAAQGVTNKRGFRTAPSAGALYPLELYVVAGAVEGLAAGAYRYLPEDHSLVRVTGGDLRKQVAEAALNQSFVARGAVVFVFTAVYERTTQKYGERGIRYVHMEAGHAAQNLLLEATALGLAAVPVGAFHDNELANVVGLPEGEHPLYVIPVGTQA